MAFRTASCLWADIPRGRWTSSTWMRRSAGVAPQIWHGRWSYRACLVGGGDTSGIVHCSNCAGGGGAATVTCSCAGGVRTQRQFQRRERGRWWLGLRHIRQQCAICNTFFHFPQSFSLMCQCPSIPWRKWSLNFTPPFTLMAGLCFRCCDVQLQIEVCQLITVSKWTVNLTTTSPDSRWD